MIKLTEKINVTEAKNKQCTTQQSIPMYSFVRGKQAIIHTINIPFHFSFYKKKIL